MFLWLIILKYGRQRTIRTLISIGTVGFAYSYFGSAIIGWSNVQRLSKWLFVPDATL